GPNHPATFINLDDANAFCHRLSELPAERALGRKYRLPTEAEWEYACRAGATNVYGFGNDVAELGDYAWFFENSNWETHPVGEKTPNPWGLYDMIGNVSEWVDAVWEMEHPKGDAIDPTGRTEGVQFTIRGGSWGSEARHCRASWRSGNIHVKRDDDLGFRVALTAKGKFRRPPFKLRPISKSTAS
ncbi:MAG: formylglycine-generating enzyme family protein, partial [Planctomycetaceae bacterium]